MVVGRDAGSLSPPGHPGMGSAGSHGGQGAGAAGGVTAGPHRAFPLAGSDPLRSTSQSARSNSRWVGKCSPPRTVTQSNWPIRGPVPWGPGGHGGTCVARRGSPRSLGTSPPMEVPPGGPRASQDLPTFDATPQSR